MLNFATLFTSHTPLIDVRAPIEFEEGHFPESQNLPLMTNEERHLVGIEYKKMGQSAAIALGHRLVKNEIKEARVQAWLQMIEKNPNAKLYCFRGGLRSQTSAAWIQEAGKQIEIIPGGYKALRRFLIEQLEERMKSEKIIILCGTTGSRKTEFLPTTRLPFLDLEKLANHRGSSFGNLGTQPAQITFENSVSIELLKINPLAPLLIEDESLMIGKLLVPRNLFQRMIDAPRVVLERSFEERLISIAELYVAARILAKKESIHDIQLSLSQSLGHIQKRLGGLETKLAQKDLLTAFQSEDPSDPKAHFSWIERILKHYYDPYYERGIQKNREKILFRGNENECRQFLNQVVL